MRSARDAKFPDRLLFFGACDSHRAADYAYSGIPLINNNATPLEHSAAFTIVFVTGVFCVLQSWTDALRRSGGMRQETPLREMTELGALSHSAEHFALFFEESHRVYSSSAVSPDLHRMQLTNVICARQ